MVDVLVPEQPDEKPSSRLRKRTTQLELAERLGYRLEGNIKFLNFL